MYYLHNYTCTFLSLSYAEIIKITDMIPIYLIRLLFKIYYLCVKKISWIFSNQNIQNLLNCITIFSQSKSVLQSNIKLIDNGIFFARRQNWRMLTNICKLHGAYNLKKERNKIIKNKNCGELCLLYWTRSKM